MFQVGGLKHVMNQDLDGTARGESIDYLVLDCLYRFRYSTEYCLCRLKTACEGLKASEKDAQLQKEYCERHPNKPTPGPGRLYKTVTQAAFRQKLRIPANLIIDSGFIRSSKSPNAWVSIISL